jgi:hypothetical protein
MRKILILFFVLPIVLFGQRADVWVFGASYMMDFKESTPQVKYIDVSNSASSSEGEISAVYCDENGNLKYFFLPNVIRGVDLDTLENGAEINNNQTNTRGAMFVPYPGQSDSVLFLATTKTGSSAAGYLYQSVVYNDTVVRKNILVSSNKVIEGVTAIPHDNGIDYWILSHSADSGSNEFQVFLLTASGLSSIPVLSNIGLKNGCLNGACGDAQAIEANSCGNKIAYMYLNEIQIFDFDQLTGEISNLSTTIIADADTIAIPNAYPDIFYGLEFSPNGNYLYCTRLYNRIVLQLDLTTGSDTLHTLNADTIANFFTASFSRLGDIDIAPNGKMYVAHHTWGGALIPLSSIEYPNEKGQNCGFKARSHPEVTGEQFHTPSMGLPNYVKSFSYNSSRIVQLL